MSAEVSSPKATGGGGTAFEFKVQASFLATLLVNGRYPCSPAGKADFIRLQARQLGYQTDDIFVQFASDTGGTHRLLVQVKSKVSFTESDADFCSALTGAWDDFTNPKLFDSDKDALLLVTGPGSDKAISHFRPVLNRSRTSVSEREYFDKLAAPKVASDSTRTYLATIKSIVTAHVGSAPADAMLWRFLR